MGDLAIKAGEFRPGHSWSWGEYRLLFTQTGNLELRKGSAGLLLWHSKTRGATKLAMQEDGNLVIYASGDRPIWTSGTHGNPSASLRLQTDGNMVIYSKDQRPLWATNTHH